MIKKDIDVKTTVSQIIKGFVSYAFLIGFIVFFVLFLFNNLLNNFSGTTTRGLYITLPLIAIILLYFIVHGICKLSTYDVFKNSKTNPDNYKKIVKYLNIFFIICIILSICVFLELLYLNLSYQAKTIEYSILKYKVVFSDEHVSNLANNMISSYYFSKTNLVISTVILVIGLSISLLSLIPYQRKMILKYNKYEENLK